MKKTKENFNIFGLSMIDLFACAMGAFLLLYILQIDKIANVNTKLNQAKQAVQRQIALTEQARNETSKAKSEAAQAKSEAEKANEKAQAAEQRAKESEKAISKIQNELQANRTYVFVLDNSGSMAKEGRMGELKNNVRILMSTMNSDYLLDLLKFPAKSGQKYCFSRPTSLTLRHKDMVFSWMKKNMDAQGDTTPTSEALKEVIRNSEYKEAGAIILITDGKPDGVKNKTDADQMIDDIKTINNNSKKIFTIGVGAVFRENGSGPGKSDLAIYLLKRLAAENGGIYTGPF